jgi:hypothetical protein
MPEQSTSPTPAIPPGFLTEQEAAAFLNMSVSFLAKDRTSDRPPRVPFVKWGRSVRYSRAILQAIAEGR